MKKKRYKATPKKSNSMIVLAGIVLLLIFGLFLFPKFLTLEKKSLIQKITPSNNSLSDNVINKFPTSFPTLKKYPKVCGQFPEIIEVNSSELGKNAKKYNDPRGYSIFYPNDWFVAAINNEVQQIQNWDSTLARRGPMDGISRGDAKWDVNFISKPFVSLYSVLDSHNICSEVTYEKIEHAQKNSLDYYFYYDRGERDNFANADLYHMGFVLVENGIYIHWDGYYSDEDQLNFLKSSAFSLKKN